MGRGKRNTTLGGNLSGVLPALNVSTYYRQYYDRLMELSMVMFEWTNVPESVDIRFLEKALFHSGKAVFFRDEVMGEMALKCATDGGFNVYGEPVRRRAFADNGYSVELTSDDSVIIWNNYLHTGSQTDVRIYARRLANIDATIDINMHAQKTPILIRCNEQQRLTMLNLYAKYEGNEPFIFGDSKLDMNNMQVFTTGAPFIIDKLREEKNQVWNEAMTHLGISNINITKRERLITDEVIRGQGGTIASRYSRLEMRRKACKKINQMFGLDIHCDYREDYREFAALDTNGGGETGDSSEKNMEGDK